MRARSTPALHRLGTAEWEQVKRRAKRAVAEIADDLLELYAAREVVQGHAFSPDAAWQHELEASFPYVETEDQLVAIEAVKQDMEQPRPMDRLICGDVGYGKTEVALRAAFKAVMDGKQVAVLVPTTVLAQQHYTNFSRRLAAFPVKVAMLSRFQTPAQQDRALSRAGQRQHRPGDRHAPPAEQGCRVQGPGPADRGRGAALRRGAQGAHQATAHRGGRADPDRHARSRAPCT